MIILTDDERTVLMITDRGESLAAIGRWEQPVEHLVEIGYLQRHDKFNNTITEAGRLALNDEQEIVDTAAAKALIAASNMRVTQQVAYENIAGYLAFEARERAKATGDELLVALQKCVAAVRDRAINLLEK